MYFLKEQSVWILRHEPSQICAAGFAEEIRIIWFLSQLHCWGIWWTASDAAHSLAEATAWSCPLLLRRKVNPVTRCKSYLGTEGLLGTCLPFPFTVWKEILTMSHAKLEISPPSSPPTLQIRELRLTEVEPPASWCRRKSTDLGVRQTWLVIF